MVKSFYILICIAISKLCLCDRRRTQEHESVLGKKYLVYFVKSPYSKADDDSWLCAGALVSPKQILTAAACLVEMERIYAIAGYTQYIHGRDIDNDPCTKMSKQKVVKITVPKEYKLSSDKPATWINIDIGVAIVEKPYSFPDQGYRVHCSYEPQIILINFEKNNEVEKTRALAVGWREQGTGSPSISSTQDIKSQPLQEATMMIIDSKECASLAPNEELQKLLDKYFLCVSGNRLLDGDDGDSKSGVDMESCPHERRVDLIRAMDDSCPEDDFDFRRRNTNANETNVRKESHNNDTKINNTSSRRSPSSESCQNDHGGPLVKQFGVQEMVIGIALSGISNQNHWCNGPRLYVSTAETAEIIKCLLEMDATKRRLCNDQIDDKRYEVNEIEIKWPENPYNQSPFEENAKQIPAYLRQGNEEEPLHVRPTKDLGDFQDDPGKQSQFGKRDEFAYEPQVDQKRSQYYASQDQSQDQVQGQINGHYREQFQRQQQPYDPYDQPREESNVNSYKPPQEEPYRQSQVESYNQPSYADSYNQPQVDPYRQPQMDSYQPQVDSYSQPRLDSFSQPRLDSYSPPQVDSYSPPQLDSYNNPPQVDSYNQPLADSYNQPQEQSYNQPQVQQYDQPPEQSYNEPQANSNNRPQVESYNPPQMESYNPSQMESYNPPQVESYNPSKNDPYNPPKPDPYNSPKFESYNPPKPDSYNSPKFESYNPPKVESYNPPKVESYNPPKMESYNPPQVEPYSQPQMESYNQPLVESYKKPPVDTNNQPQGQMFKQPQTDAYKPPQIESYKQPQRESNNQLQRDPHRDSYKPPQLQLSNQPQPDPNNKPESGSFKQPQIQPYLPQLESNKQPQIPSYSNPDTISLKTPSVESYNPLEIISGKKTQVDTFTIPIVEPFKPPPVEPYNQPAQEPYMSQPFKPAPVEPYEQPQLRQLDQTRLPQNVIQPFEQVLSPLFTQSVDQSQSALRERLLGSGGLLGAASPPEAPLSDTQTFEQIYAQLNSPVIPPPAIAASEQTFEELYKNLHDPALDIPHDQEFEMLRVVTDQTNHRSEQPFDQQFDQTFGQMPKLSDEPEKMGTQPSEKKQDEVKVRPQVPLDYQDYLSYSRRSETN